MIPLLLWRCPLCVTNDALVHVERPFRSGRVHCRHCGAEWRVRRVPGDSFYLKLIHVGQNDAFSHEGDERSITAWYDAMKATVRLAPIHDPALPLPPGETLYLASGPAELQAEATDPLFFPVPESPRASRVDKKEVAGRTTGQGRVFLTSRRLIWQGDGPARSFPLTRLNSAYAVMDYGLTLMVEMRLYTVRFLAESLLKWVTYLALIVPEVEAETGHRIATSHS